MRKDKIIICCSILAFGLLALFGVYLRYFPVILSPTFTNIMIIGLIVVLLALLVFEPFQITRSLDTYILLPQYLLFAFLVRAATTLRLTYQPLDDPNYYAVCTRNILDFGTLEPIYSWWYPLVQQQLVWPDLHLLGAVLTHITNIFSVDVLRLSLPLYGMLFFLGAFLLAREVTKNTTVAFLAGLFASTADSVIFYQAEYHPQGLAIILFVFLMVLVVRYLTTGSSTTAILVLIYLVAISFCHHFTSLYLGIFSLYMFVMLWLPRTIYIAIFGYNPIPNIRATSVFWLLASMMMFLNHLYNYPSFISSVKGLLGNTAPFGQLITAGQTIPLQVTVLNSSKYILLVLALISIIYVLKTKDEREFLAVILVAGIGVSGVVATFVAYVPVDRLITFYISFAAIFASLTLYRVKNNWFAQVRHSLKTATIVAISLVILFAGPFNFMPPAIILHDLPEDPYYWHDNDFTAFSTFGVPGYWIKDHIETSAKFSTYNETTMIPFFYGEHPLNNIYGGSSTGINSDYYIAEANYAPNQGDTGKNSVLLNYAENSIYTMGRFHIGTGG